MVRDYSREQIKTKAERQQQNPTDDLFDHTGFAVHLVENSTPLWSHWSDIHPLLKPVHLGRTAHQTEKPGFAGRDIGDNILSIDHAGKAG
jgi:hypothetical protein